MFVLALLIGICVGYGATVHADFLIHRNIWHGRWKIVHRGPFKWLLNPHYIHHWKAHHTHAARHPAALETGAAVPQKAHADLEAKYDDQWNVRYGLRCTHHGITIVGLECVCHYLAVFLFTPQPYISLFLWITLGAWAGLPAAMMPLCAVGTQICHKYYHMSVDARRDAVPKWLHWLLLSPEFNRMADEHVKHHYDPRFADDYYGVLPFGNLLLRPLCKKN
jgi:hypothetical protein